jgi:LCP family protein required for cell wall assembly
VSSPPRPDRAQRPPRGRSLREPRVTAYGSHRPAAPDRLSPTLRFRRALALLVLSTFLPGSAQLVAGNKRVGRTALRIWAVVVAVGLGALVVALVSPSTIRGLGFRPGVLLTLRFGLLLLALGWLALLVDAWRLGRPGRLQARQRAVATVVASALALGLCGPAVWASHLAGVHRDFITSVFAEGSGVEVTDGRLNVLLLGGDSGKSRVGTRPDSITLASVDVATGRTVMFSLPRNLEHARFPAGTPLQTEFPRGFDGMLNSVYTYGVEHAELFPGVRDPGAEATKQAVAGTLGLPVHYYVLVNLKGFRELVDALGGIRIDVEARVPIGGIGSPVVGYIEPGVQKLDGYHALWYSRSREGSTDYVRMARQRCVMGALLAQAEPMTVLRRFQAIASSAKALVQTDLPQQGLPGMVELALRAKGRKVTSVQFVPPLITSAEPDVELIQARVRRAVGQARGDARATVAAAPKKRRPKTAAGPATPSAGASDPGAAKGITETCSYG